MKDAVIVNPKNKPEATIVWTHGLGADGHDFEGIIPELKVAELNIRFIFPHAPVQPITINGGMAMRGWYDIKNITSLEREVDNNGIQDSVDRILKIIDAQLAEDIPSEKIILAGFSQGGVIALNSAFQCEHQLGAVIALSTYLPNWDHFKSKNIDKNNEIPFIVAHGTVDPVVPYQAGQHLVTTLKDERFNVDFHSYPMQHQVCLEEIQMLSKWIFKILK
ncbi:alpha/beta hydrolase [Francisellaceae bacterium]|nr:alpha/beta hydrolase [Francisellaceae bacterium]